jgi:FtsP/CotA-like multicopper oxidase with cupredoxin domain
MKRKQLLFCLAVFCFTAMLFYFPPVTFSQNTQILDPSAIPQFVNQLTQPPTVFAPTNVTDKSGNLIRQEYTVNVSEFTQQILPTTTAEGEPTGFGRTTVWGYEGEAMNAVTGEAMGVVASTPGSTFQAIQGVPVQVKWVNNLVDSEGKPLSYMVPVDPTIHWANPNNLPMDMTSTNAPSFPPGDTEVQTPVPIVTHLHGGEVQSTSDGGPNAWYTADGKHGPDYNTAVPTDPNAAVDVYPNGQQPTTLWYHDHALGVTRLNVLSGLAGFYIISNASDPVEQLLPHGEYDVPLAIQDRSFYSDGSLYYPTEGVNPAIHPYWQDTFLGNTIVVNGEAWPNMNVKQGLYRFRVLDGSNDRLYQISLSNGMAFTQIGTDGGYLKAPAQMTSQLIAPGERIDILVDFSNVPAGQKIILENYAGSSSGGVAPQTTGQIMQFTVTDGKGLTPKPLPSNLNPTLAGDFPNLPTPSKTRILTLTAVPGPSGSEEMLLDGQTWSASISEKPTLGSTEDWVIVNPTMDNHPIHVHLVQFQFVQRQAFAGISYMDDWSRLNGDPPLNHTTVNVPSITPYLTGTPTGPTASEQGWKDTIVVNSGEVVTIRLRWAEQNGNQFPFDATVGSGYVWHCHMLEHEDNEMMRPYIVVSPAATETLNLGTTITIVVTAAIITVLATVLFFKRLRGRTPK